MRVEVKAIHAGTHEDHGNRAVLDKAMLGSRAPTRQLESFNLDAIINGEHVLLACDDPKGCEAPAVGTHDGELVKHGKWVRMTFKPPLTEKHVTRWYRVAGTW